MKSKNPAFQLNDDDSAKTFFDFLEGVPENLNEFTIDRFFSSSIYYVNNESSSPTEKYYIICSLAKSLISQANIEVFVNGNYLSQLPFKFFNVQEKILDIIFIITTYAPNGITNEVAIKFGHLITRYPRKCLNVLSVFAERFQVAYNPWKMIDLLFKYCGTFIGPENVDDYISILSFLNSNFKCFRESRLKHTWFAYCQIIQKSKLDCTKSNAYYSMCQLYELRPRVAKKCLLPESVSDDLANPLLQKSVISLLLRCSQNQVSELIIQTLLKIKNEDCFLALSVLAENKDCARILTNDLSWLQEEIPSKEGTMKIFVKLLKNSKYDLIKSPEVVTFLNSIINDGKDIENVENQSLITASTFVRYLPVNNRFVGYLSHGDFLSNYFNIALQRDDESVVNSTLLLIDTIAKRGDAIELADVCDFVKENVINNNPTASKAAADLALYPRCAKEFQKNGLTEYIEKNPNLPNSSNFLSNYQKSIKRPVRAPPAVSPPRVKKSTNNISPQKELPIKKQNQQQSQDTEKIKTRNVVLHQPEPEPEPKLESDHSSEPETEHIPEPQPEPERIPEPEPESDQKTEPELESGSNSDTNSKNGDEVLLPENSSDDFSVSKEEIEQKPSVLPNTPSTSPSSIRSSAVSSPSASGVYDPYIPPNIVTKNSPLAKARVMDEESESSHKSEFSDSFKSSILKNRTADSEEDSLASETENMNPSLSPIKQRSIIPASPLNRSKIRSVGSIGSIGSISDDNELRKSSSIISIDLPPPEQNTQNLLPDSLGGLTYVKQGSPPPKPRPSRNKE